MAIEDYLEPEVVVAVAVTAAISSPTVRSILRRGAVYGMAGLMVAGDAITSAARGVGRSVQQMTASADEVIHENGDRPAGQPANAARARRRPETARRRAEGAREGAEQEKSE